jgi:hypothetical protein
MKSYKVEVEEIHTYVFDVQAKTEAEAKEIGKNKWEEACESGMQHYHETGDTRSDMGTVYDVTGTDDDAFIDNK